jgi:transposase-like protein
LARLREKPVAQIAADLGISDSCLRNWMAQADVDEGRREGLSSGEREELVELRREARTLKLENEILKWAAAYFARENVLPCAGTAGYDPEAGLVRGLHELDVSEELVGEDLVTMTLVVVRAVDGKYVSVIPDSWKLLMATATGVENW